MKSNRLHSTIILGIILLILVLCTTFVLREYFACSPRPVGPLVTPASSLTGLVQQETPDQTPRSYTGGLQPNQTSSPLLQIPIRYDTTIMTHCFSSNPQKVLEYMTDNGEYANVVYDTFTPSQNSILFAPTSRHFQIVCPITMEVVDGLFGDSWKGFNIVEDIAAFHAKNPQYSLQLLRLHKWAQLMLFILEDWRIWIVEEQKYKDPNYQAIGNTGTGKYEKRKSFVPITHDDLPPNKHGNKFVCGACGIMNGLNVNMITARAIPISGGVAHEYGHTIQMAYKYDKQWFEHSGLPSLSESFGEWWIYRLIYYDKTITDPAKIEQLCPVNLIWHSNYMLCNSRVRYETYLWFQFLVENPYRLSYNTQEAEKLIHFMLDQKQIAYERSSKIKETYLMYKGNDMWSTLYQFLNRNSVDLKDYFFLYTKLYVAYHKYRDCTKMLKRFWPAREITVRWDPMEQFNRYTARIIPVPDKANEGWWMVMDQYRLQQSGFNLVRLKKPSNATGQCKVSFQGLRDEALKSDWRFGIVVLPNNDIKNAVDIPTIGKNGESISFNASSPDDNVYLVVSCLPDHTELVEYFGMNGLEEFLPTPTTPLKTFHPYEIKLENLEPNFKLPCLVDVHPTGIVNIQAYDLGKHKINQDITNTTLFRRHSNGGGYVHVNAVVDPTAYVGPNAVVFKNCEVRGKARVEDCAVLYTDVENAKCVIQDNAVISGHAYARNHCLIKDNAKVRDYGYVRGGDKPDSLYRFIVQDNARILEGGMLQYPYGQTVDMVVGDNATVRGYAAIQVYKTVNCAVIDWDFWEGDNKTHFTHGHIAGFTSYPSYHDRFQNSKVLNNREFEGVTPPADNKSCYLEYTMDKYTQVYVHANFKAFLPGILRGAPTFSSDASGAFMSLSSANRQYVLLPQSCSDMRYLTVVSKFALSNATGDQCLFTLGSAENGTISCYPVKNNNTVIHIVVKYKVNGAIVEKTFNTGLSAPMSTMSNLRVTWNQRGITCALETNEQTYSQMDPGIFFDSLTPPNTGRTSATHYLGRSATGDFFSGKVYTFALHFAEPQGAFYITKSYPQPSLT